MHNNIYIVNIGAGIFFWYPLQCMDSVSRNYELTYLLSSSIPEDGVLAAASEISRTVEQARGIVNRMETPKKRQLAYPIKKETAAYFGWIAFSSAPDGVAGLDKRAKEDKRILRHLIVEEEVETRVPFVRPIGPRRPAVGEKPAPAGEKPAREKAPEETLDLEALDKKLEEILGK